MYKLSIIVPIYNVEKYLEICIKSILNQSFKDFELILVDDGSPDNCGNICDYYSNLDSRVKVIHKKNGGLSSARNAGLEIATGEYIGFVDSDDWIEKTMYEELYNLAKNNNADIVQCKFKKVFDECKDNDINYIIGFDRVEIINNMQALEKLIKFGEIHVQMVVTWNKIYKKELFNNIRFPNGKIHEDEFTTYKLLYKANIIVLTDRETYYYRQIQDSIMNSKFNKRRLDYLDALEEMIDFFNSINNKELYKLAMIRYINSSKTYYFKCYDLLENNDIILKNLENQYKTIYKEYKSNCNMSLKNKINNEIFCINPQIYRIMQRLRRR